MKKAPDLRSGDKQQWRIESRLLAACTLLVGLLVAGACNTALSAGTAQPSQTIPASAAGVTQPQAAAGTVAPPSTIPGSMEVSSATPTTSPTDTLTPTLVPINPLTGMPIANLSLVQRRPIGIKVSNYPRTARPQAGLTSADVLFEYYQEAGDTRFHAIFLSQEAAPVGPIRSGRWIDYYLEQIFNSIYVFNAEDFRIWNVTHSLKKFQDVEPNIVVFTDDKQCPAICEDNNQAPINRFVANTAEVRKFAVEQHGVKDIAPDFTGWNFQQEPPPMAQDASTARVKYLTNWAVAEWRYNPADHLYYRWSDTDKTPIYGNGALNLSPLIDRNNKKQLTVSNLIVLWMNYQHETNVEIYDVNFYGSGMALFFRDGKMEPGSWRLPCAHCLPRFYGNSNQGSYLLRPGVSWITLVDDQSTYTVEGGTAKIEFSMPG
jgi:hypothetical protein